MILKGKNYEIFRQILFKLQQEQSLPSLLLQDSSIIPTEIDEDHFSLLQEIDDDDTSLKQSLINSKERIRTRESFLKCMTRLESRRLLKVISVGTFSFTRASDVKILIESLEAEINSSRFNVIVRGQFTNQARTATMIGEQDLMEAKREISTLLKINSSSLGGKKQLIATYLARNQLIDLLLFDCSKLQQSTTRLNAGDTFGQSALVASSTPSTSSSRKSSYSKDRFLHTEHAAVMSISKEGLEELSRMVFLKIVDDRVAFLKSYPFIMNLLDRDILNFIPDAAYVVLRKDTLVYKESDSVEGIYFLKDGAVELQGWVTDPKTASSGYLSSRSKESPLQSSKRLLTLFQFERGSHFGDLEYFQPSTSSRTTRAVVVSSTATFLFMKYSALNTHLRSNISLEVLRNDSQTKANLYENRMKEFKIVHNIVEETKFKEMKEKADLMEIIAHRKSASMTKFSSAITSKTMAASPMKKNDHTDGEISESIQTSTSLKKNALSKSTLNTPQKTDVQEFLDMKNFKEVNQGYQQFKLSLKNIGGEQFSLSKELKNEVANRIQSKGKLRINHRSIKNFTEFAQLSSNREGGRPSTTTSALTTTVHSRMQSQDTSRVVNEAPNVRSKGGVGGALTDRANSRQRNGVVLKRDDNKLKSMEFTAENDEMKLKQLGQLVSQGKNNFHQIFLQSLMNSNEKKISLGQLRGGEKIDKIMEKKYDKNFQGYLKKQVEYHQLRGEAPKKISPSSGAFISHRSSSSNLSNIIAEVSALQTLLTPRKFVNPFI